MTQEQIGKVLMISGALILAIASLHLCDLRRREMTRDKRDKCDRCGAKVAERFQCGPEWLCILCVPADIFKRYPEMKKLRSKASA